MGVSLNSLFFVEIGVTLVLGVMLVWRSFEDMKEDDHLVLDEAEAHLDREQAVIRRKLKTLNRYIRVAGVVWSLLAVVLASMWVAKGLALT